MGSNLTGLHQRVAIFRWLRPDIGRRRQILKVRQFSITQASIHGSPSCNLFMHNIYKLHDLPMAIISDRYRIFTSNVWQELFKLSQTQLRLSSSYHPQTNG